MSGHLLYVYKNDGSGRIVHKLIDSSELAERLRAGWHDSPSKVPGGRTGEPLMGTEATVSREPAPAPPSIVEQLPIKERKGGWPRGVSRAQMARGKR